MEEKTNGRPVPRNGCACVGIHEHGPGYETVAIMRYLREHPSVRSFGTVEDVSDARRLLSENHVNTVFITPRFVHDSANKDYESLDAGLSLIRDVRKRYPKIVFVLYDTSAGLEHIGSFDSRFRNYFQIDTELWSDSEVGKRELDLVTDKCQIWHRELFNYDVAVSFAGEERDFARQVAESLKREGLNVFFDEYFDRELVGSNLRKKLYSTYFNESRFCVMVISEAYRDKEWTSHEREAAFDQMLKERGTDYYLVPVRVDSTHLDGLSASIGYVSHERGAAFVASVVSTKTWADPSAKKRKLGTWLFDTV